MLSEELVEYNDIRLNIVTYLQNHFGFLSLDGVIDHNSALV